MAMSRDFVIDALACRATIKEAHRFRPFVNGVRDFRHVLKAVPDAAAGEITGAQIDELRTLSASVIELIESRIDLQQDSTNDQRALAEQVYAIQLALEKIDHWRRHFIGQ